MLTLCSVRGYYTINLDAVCCGIYCTCTRVGGVCIDGNHATAFLIRVHMSLDSSEDTHMINIDNKYSRHMAHET